MSGSVREMVARKISQRTQNQEPDKDELYTRYHSSNLDEAREAGNVQEMIHYKRAARRLAHKSVITLSNEYYDQMSISDILKGIKATEKEVASNKELMDDLYEREQEKALSEYSKRFGTTDSRVQALVAEHMDSWNNEQYLQISNDYKNAKKRLTALNNAKSMYLEDNKELIEAEKQRVKREELLSSGLLEDLGIVTTAKARR